MVLTHVQSLYDHSHILHLVATYWHTPRIYIPVATHTYKPRPCLDDIKISSFFTLSPSHQFLAACMEY
jgi:hypothetical protein